MKTIIVLLLAAGLGAQENPVCQERGHISTGACMITDMHCSDRFVDLPDQTIRISYNCNPLKCSCDRCGLEFIVGSTAPDTTVVWQRKIDSPQGVLELPVLGFGKKPVPFRVQVGCNVIGCLVNHVYSLEHVILDADSLIFVNDEKQ